LPAWPRAAESPYCNKQEQSSLGYTNFSLTISAELSIVRKTINAALHRLNGDLQMLIFGGKYSFGAVGRKPHVCIGI